MVGRGVKEDIFVCVYVTGSLFTALVIVNSSSSCFYAMPQTGSHTHVEKVVVRTR